MASRSLDDLRPAVKAKAECFLGKAKAAGHDVLITCTLRTMDEQAALYAQGRTVPGKRVTKAKPGQSAHNFGLAFDFVPMIGGKPEWSGKHPVWQELGAMAEACGLEWGGRWRGFLDLPHCQEPNWKEHV